MGNLVVDGRRPVRRHLVADDAQGYAGAQGSASSPSRGGSSDRSVLKRLKMSQSVTGIKLQIPVRCSETGLHPRDSHIKNRHGDRFKSSSHVRLTGYLTHGPPKQERTKPRWTNSRSELEMTISSRKSDLLETNSNQYGQHLDPYWR